MFDLKKSSVIKFCEIFFAQFSWCVPQLLTTKLSLIFFSYNPSGLVNVKNEVVSIQKISVVVSSTAPILYYI